MLIAAMLACAYLDFFAYRAQGYTDPAFLNDRLLGRAVAPEQYRVGIVWLAHFLAVHLHIALTMAVASVDLVSGLVAVLVLFSVLECSEIYRTASVSEQWFGAAAFVLLVVWFLGWLLWLQKPETLPAAMLVALLLWLWQAPVQQGQWLWKAILSVVLTLLLATFRADMACLLNFGILLFILARPGLAVTFPRPAAIVITLMSAVAAAAAQLYLMQIVYPHANYGRVKLWQLWPNMKHASRWPPFVLFLLPLFWMGVQAARRRFDRDPAGLAFLTGAVCFSALWVTIGKIDEVRIFMAFALALAPLTAQMAMLRVSTASPRL